MDKEKIAEKLNDFFGDKTVKVIMPKQFLANLSIILTKQNEEIIKQIKNNNLSPILVEDNKKIRELLIELKKAIIENKIDKVEISNFPEYPKFPEIKIPEQKEIKIPEYPTKINLLQPSWYEKIQDKFISFLSDGFQFIKKSFAEDLDSHMDKEKAIAVRLVSMDKSTFYNAIFSGGGGGIITTSDATAANQVLMINLLTTIDADTGNLTAILTALQIIDNMISGNEAQVDIVSNKLDTAPRIGQAKIAVTATAVQLGANALLNGVIITAKSTNTAAITVGGAAVTNTVDGTGNGYILEAGASTSFAVDNTNVLYINGTAGDIISFSGS